MKKLITIISVLFSTLTIFAQVIVTPASGGQGSSGTGLTPADLTDGWATLGSMHIQETSKGDIPENQIDVTLILTAPGTWIFNTAVGNVQNDAQANNTDFGNFSISYPSSNQIQITFTTDNNANKIDGFTITNLQVQPDAAVYYPAADIVRTGGSAIMTGISSSTNFGTLSTDQANPAPVELTSFSANLNGNIVNLQWNTATEVNNYGFEIQRSKSTKNWEVLGFVEGHGNSNSPKNYNFTDSKLDVSGTCSYRLKQIDNDGSYEFSKIIEVNIGAPVILELKQNYPNPFNPSTTISFTLPESGNVSLRIFNTLGEEVTTLVNGYTEAGIYSYNFNAENLPSGFYIYQLNTKKYSLTKKMLFLK
ncbi:T9SS type A sorting domain-containing protein [bacterium BMS3Abin03]|nr:T9SS type A sorting domain-containing protein [bacterium BMS3Abin03]